MRHGYLTVCQYSANGTTVLYESNFELRVARDAIARRRWEDEKRRCSLALLLSRLPVFQEDST